MSKRKKSGMKRIGLLLTMVMVFTMITGAATPAAAGWFDDWLEAQLEELREQIVAVLDDIFIDVDTISVNGNGTISTNIDASPPIGSFQSGDWKLYHFENLDDTDMKNWDAEDWINNLKDGYTGKIGQGVLTDKNQDIGFDVANSSVHSGYFVFLVKAIIRVYYYDDNHYIDYPIYGAEIKKINPLNLTANATPAPPATVLVGGNVTLTSSASGGADMYPYTFSWGDEYGSFTSNEQNPSSPASPTALDDEYTYTVTVTDVLGGHAEKSVFVKTEAPALSVDAGSDFTVTYGDSTTLTATPTGGYGAIMYEWYIGDQKQGDGQSLAIAPVMQTATYTVKATDSLGTVAEDDVTVTVEYKKISIMVDKVIQHLNNTVTAYFGYYNRNLANVSIPVGNDNKFSPGPDQGQTSDFAPGRVQEAFGVNFSSGNMVWTLKSPNGQASTTTASATVNDGSKSFTWCEVNLRVMEGSGFVSYSYETNGTTVNGVTTHASEKILVPYGTVLSLTPAPTSGYLFTKWGGVSESKQQNIPLQVTINKPRWLRVYYEEITPGLTITGIDVTNAVKDASDRSYTGNKVKYDVTVENTGNVPVTDIRLTDGVFSIDESIGTLAPDESITISLNNSNGKGYRITSGWPFTDSFTAAGKYGETDVSDSASKTTYRKLELEALVSDDLTNSLKWKATNMNAGLDLEAQWRIGEIGEGITQTGNVTVPASGSVEFTSVYDGDNQKCMLFVDDGKHVARAGNYTEVKAWEFYKQADVEKGLVAQEHTYTITVQNVGNIPLDDLTIMDSLTGTVVEDLDLNPLESRSFTVAFTPYADDLYEVDEVWYLDNTATLYQENPGNVVRMTIALDDDPDRLSWLAEDSVTLEVQMRYLLELSGGAHGRVEANYADAGVSQRVAGDSISVWLYPDTAVHINTSSHSGYQFGYWVGGPWNMRLRNPSVAMTSDISSRAVHVEIQEQATPSPSPSTSPAGLTGIFRAFAAPSPTPAPTPSPSPTPTPQVTPAPSESAAPPADTGGDDDTVTIDENDVPAGTASAKGTGFFSHWWSWMVLALGLLLLLLVLLLILSRRKKGQEQH